MGYACVIVSNSGARYLEARGRELLTDSGLQRFHGREFNPGCERQVNAYDLFSKAIRDTLERGGEYAAFNLLHPSAYGPIFDEFAPRVTDGALSVLMERAPDFCIAKAGAMFWLSRRLARLEHMNGATALVELDQDQPGDEQAGKQLVGLAGELGTLLVPASDALVRAANAYKRQQFPRGPSIGALRACRSADSMLIQAADLVGNFGLALLKAKLRKDSAPQSQRAQVRARIFRELMPEIPIEQSGTLRLNGKDEIEGSEDDNVLLELKAFPER